MRWVKCIFDSVNTCKPHKVCTSKKVLCFVLEKWLMADWQVNFQELLFKMFVNAFSMVLFCLYYKGQLCFTCFRGKEGEPKIWNEKSDDRDELQLLNWRHKSHIFIRVSSKSSNLNLQPECFYYICLYAVCNDRKVRLKEGSLLAGHSLVALLMVKFRKESHSKAIHRRSITFHFFPPLHGHPLDSLPSKTRTKRRPLPLRCVN